MHLLVIRHAIARDKLAWGEAGRPDELRPLTRKGRRLMRRNLRGLVQLVGTPDVLAASPLVRAWETAEIVARAFAGLEIEEATVLAPGQPPSAVAGWLREFAGRELVAIVGHEPGLGLLVSWLLAGGGAFMQLRKGGACLLELEGVESASAALLWSVTPRQLRRIARRV
jgi:phosphohistidine phosphatase